MGYSASWQMPDRAVTKSTKARLILCCRWSQALKPKDQLEAMLAAQMVAIHMATMTFARRLAHVDTVQQQDSAERALNKLARTYAMQMETFKRYRTGGEQKVTVQHVSVSEGGQAIVGNVTQPDGRHRPGKARDHDAGADRYAEQAMPIIKHRAGVNRCGQEKRWRAIIRVIPARCLIAGAAGRSRARASPAGLQRLPAKSAAGCTAVHRDRARPAVIRMRSNMGAIRAKPSRNADNCGHYYGNRLCWSTK